MIPGCCTLGRRRQPAWLRCCCRAAAAGDALTGSSGPQQQQEEDEEACAALLAALRGIVGAPTKEEVTAALRAELEHGNLVGPVAAILVITQQFLFHNMCYIEHAMLIARRGQARQEVSTGEA